MAWPEIMDKDVSLLWEHNALTCHFNIMNNITMVSPLPFTFLRRVMLLYLCPFSYYASAANGSSDLYTYWRSYISVNTLSMVFLILFAPTTTMSMVVMPVKYRLV